MRKEESSRVEALEALIAERRKHEGYLAKLEERRDGTPDGVYLKLRDEYLTKLTDAQVRAAMEADALSAGLEEDEAAVAEAQEKLAALEEERLEGELRAAVGEYDPKEWTKKLTSLKAGITLAERERDARLTVFERSRALIAEAKSSSMDLPPSSGPDDAAPPSIPKMRPTSAMQAGPSFDELAFLNSVVGRNSTPGTPAPAPPPVPASPPAPRVSKPVEQVAEPAAATPIPAEPEPIVETPSTPPPAPIDEPDSNAFGKPTPRTSQAVKTLKCQECGTFNYPTEWYCERCGGELAAL